MRELKQPVLDVYAALTPAQGMCKKKANEIAYMDWRWRLIRGRDEDEEERAAGAAQREISIWWLREVLRLP